MIDAPPKVKYDVAPPETLAERLVSPRVVPLLLATGFIVVCCFSVVPLMDVCSPNDAGAFLVYMCFGVIAAAAGLVAIGGAIGPGPILLRLGVSIGLAVLLFAAWFLGWAVSDSQINQINDHEKRVLLVALLCFPIVYVSIQIPLWIMRFAFSWRCEFVGGTAAESELPPLTIRKLMIGTTLVALALAGARAAVSVASEPPSEFWLVLAIVCASTAGVSLISTLPIVWSTLRASRLVWWIIGLAVYVAIATGVTLTVVGILENGRFWEMFGLATTIVSFAAMMSAVLLSMRLLGFRLLSRNPLPE
ncbi:MAG: hypothetical protein H8E44_32135 [Planctomycetes bacterium]|nr:hypothetical protein [Planctomycetota bacterium]MBL7042106.1 hypothetical protein [Pirellulaceae bacterium]